MNPDLVSFFGASRQASYAPSKLGDRAIKQAVRNIIERKQASVAKATNEKSAK
jgi:hypothetical protein